VSLNEILLLSASCCFLAWLTLIPWRWTWCTPPTNSSTFTELHDIRPKRENSSTSNRQDAKVSQPMSSCELQAEQERWNVSCARNETLQMYAYCLGHAFVSVRLYKLCRYWVTTSKQHSSLGNRFLISKYTQPILSNAFANKHVPTETKYNRGTVFSTRSVPRCYNQDS
jgi:hypothetical protein